MPIQYFYYLFKKWPKKSHGISYDLSRILTQSAAETLFFNENLLVVSKYYTLGQDLTLVALQTPNYAKNNWQDWSHILFHHILSMVLSSPTHKGLFWQKIIVKRVMTLHFLKWLCHDLSVPETD